MKPLTFAIAALGLSLSVGSQADRSTLPDPRSVPAVRSFLGEDDFGRIAPQAPAETNQFGRLAAIWITEQQYVDAEGEWVDGPPGLWIWRYGLGGFAVTDLWVQPEGHLPDYLGDLGRDYLLSSVRIFDAREERWRQAWMANGSGSTPGKDSGTLDGAAEGDRIVMTAPPGEYGIQRIVFSDITSDSFRWTSLYSQDGGETWLTAMRVEARRAREGRR